MTSTESRPHLNIVDDTRFNAQFITVSDTTSIIVTYRSHKGGHRLADELWELWRETESKEETGVHLGRLLEDADMVESINLLSMWRHICLSAKAMADDDAMEARFRG